nr:breast carcinoma-amplified sequence 3 homolog [Helicoverpa armigera]
MSAESPRHVRSGGPLTVPSQPPSDRSIIDAVSGFINDVTLSSSSTVDPKDVIQWARFETADINEPTPEGDSDNDVSPLLLILGYGSGVQVWLIPPSGEAQEVLSWRQGTVRVLRILPTPQHGDCFASKRPLIALCDSASPGPSFCSLSFISIRGGEQVKSIKFKNPILDVLANKRSVVVSFSERFAVFDAATLEDRMAVTTCYPCPCPLGGSLPINPLALGDRWLAYADKKLNQSKRSSGGCEGEGVTSYTATVLHAAKSLSKGLRGLGESVAHSLAGGRSTSQSPSPPNADIQQPGVVTILDIEGNEEEDGQDSEEPCDPIVAHFIAHSEAIIALKFDASGMLLMTADRRGHDFHVFRINPHPCGASLASVHHLYILHRGDTTAKVQDIAISNDSRWAAVSTLRGTTHVFAISPYGGAIGVRTHTQPRVVNRLSRFHRSAGLPIHTAAAKRATATTVGDNMSQGAWFPNPRLPPYPLPTTLSPLAQLRPTANIPTHTITRNSSGRQRLSSLSEDNNSAPLLARARFGPAVSGRAPAPVAALYLMAANGCLLHLLLHPRPLSSLSKEKICDESMIELEVEPVAQWPLQRPAAAADLLAPLPPSNPLLQPQTCRRCADMCMSEEERWLSQVEIVTHAGPHRRLWMGPQFVFKTYNCTGSSSSLSEAETVEVCAGPARSNPVNMPGARPVVPVLIDSGSASSLEHSPSDSFRRKSLLAESGRAASVCDVQLREDLAEAMKEDHGAARASPPRPARPALARAVGPLGTVVQPPPAAPAPALEPYAASNADEATFRPVLRAAAPPERRPEAAARALPAGTTIPAQRVPAAPRRRPRRRRTSAPRASSPRSRCPTLVIV